jgi:hypothetical protein
LRHADLFATGKYEFFTFGKKAMSRVGRAGWGTRRARDATRQLARAIVQKTFRVRDEGTNF